MNIRTTSIAIITMIALAVTGCAPNVVDAHGDSDVDAVISKVDNADTIEAKKRPMSIGDYWTITADGHDVGTVTGETLKLIGDTYAFHTPNGHLVGAMDEQIRIVNRNAKLYDSDQESIGHISQEILRLLRVFRIHDQDGQIGKMEQNLSLAMKADIVDMDGNTEWSVDRKIFSLGASVTISREDADNVPGVHALFAALMLNEIYESSNSSSSSRSGKSS